MNVKKQIDDWLRKVYILDVSVSDLKKYKSLKGFSRSYLRELKNPVTKLTTGDFSKPLKDVSSLPSFEIENSQNLMVLVGNDNDTKIIVESFL